LGGSPLYPFELIVLCGFAGVGKTDVLRAAGALGEPILDLEGLARHRGSVFGAIGQPPQPSHEAFQRDVAEACSRSGGAPIVWVEDEGPFLGAVGLPGPLCAAMRAAPGVELVGDRELRLDRVLRDYGSAPIDQLLAAVHRARRRLGRATAARVVDALSRNDVRDAFDGLLDYYDAAYAHRREKDDRKVLASVCVDDRPPDEIARELGAIALAMRT
jgi:tRNA 2-selenouridine synthase